MEMFLEKLCKAVGRQGVKRDEPMKKHTTFRIGGPADFFVTPEDESQFLAAVMACRQEGVPYYILGNGSNLLVSDKGYRGTVIETEKALCRLEVQDHILKAGAGILLSALSKEAMRRSLTGLEAASGIPGTLGGGVVMNAGAYGFELKDVLRSVKVLDKEGQVRTIPAEELKLGYRYSLIPEAGHIVLEASLQLDRGDQDKIRARMEELAIQRRSKQPLEYPSAGSTFKRPEGHFAGKLIDEAGLRGFRVGGAQISEKHCGFVINRGDATAEDVMELCRQVQERVFRQFGVNMDMEIRKLGDL